MSDRTMQGRRHTFVAACLLGIVVIGAATWPSAAAPVGERRGEGVWALRLDVAVGAVPEAIVGVLALEKDGTCSLGVRSSFAGYAHDHTASTGPLDTARGVEEPCRWSRPPGHVDGIVTIYGLAEPGPVELSFVLADNGQRLLLLLDGTHPGITGTGEGFRR